MSTRSIRLLMVSNVVSSSPPPNYSIFTPFVFCISGNSQSVLIQRFLPILEASEWSTALAEWIRHNDESLLKSSSRVLSTFQDDLLPATSVDEIVDVCGLMQEIPSPASFLLEIPASVQ